MNNKQLHSIEIKDLIWNPGKQETPVLNRIDAMLTSGNFYGILGPNGAGKTSLVRQILKLKEPDNGRIALDDRNVHALKREELARTLAFLPQAIHADIDFTVFDIVAMGREPYRRRFSPLDAEDLTCINEALKFTNCMDLKDKSISVLSGGERQRVMIARTIAQDTPWIILDEPVSNLDIRHQTELMHVLKRLQNKKGKTVVAILHDLNLAATFCSHIILMKDGGVYQSGTVEEVLTKENLNSVYEMEFDFISDNHGERPYIMPRYSM